GLGKRLRARRRGTEDIKDSFTRARQRSRCCGAALAPRLARCLSTPCSASVFGKLGPRAPRFFECLPGLAFGFSSISRPTSRSARQAVYKKSEHCLNPGL